MSTLFFDIQITGHHTEYIGHLIDYFRSRPPSGPVTFVVHPHFADRFPQLAEKTRGSEQVRLVSVSEAEYQKATAGSLTRQSFATLRLVNAYAERYQADRVSLLSFNVFQIALIFARPRFKINGILFLQFYRMNTDSWKDRLKYFRKYWITRLYTRNKQLERVFILNDPKTADYLNRTFGTGLFHALNDPIPVLEPLHGFDCHSQYGLEPGRKILLHLGALDHRKGTLEFIRSATYMATERQEELAYLVAGSPSSNEMGEQIERQIRLVNETTRIKAIYEPGFLPEAKMKSMLDQCYAIVIPYKNPEASSGILGHAASANKPLVATGKGLLKELIEGYRLGLLVERVEPALIAERIESLLRSGDWKSASNAFTAERTPEAFAATIVGDTILSQRKAK